MIGKSASKRLRRAIVLALGLATFATSLPTAANAEGMMMRRHGMGRMGGGGGMNGLVPGLALGFGTALLFNELQHRHMHREAEVDGWTPRLQRKHDCHRAREWRKLLASAEKSLRYSLANDPGGVGYDTWRVERAKNEVAEAERACR